MGAGDGIGSGSGDFTLSVGLTVSSFIQYWIRTLEAPSITITVSSILLPSLDEQQNFKGRGSQIDMDTIWENVQKAFTDVPRAKNMTYTQHLGDGLVLSATVLCSCAGILIHTCFPMVGEGSEAFLRAYMNKRTTQTEESESDMEEVE